MVSGGFPCQDISSAGKGAGLDGERSGLWREMARIVGEVIAEKAKVKGVSKVVFDRKGYAYHGRVRALADGARAKGLVF